MSFIKEIFSFFYPKIISEGVDVAVIGGGIAGLSSGLYLGRAGVSHIVLEGETPGGAIIQSTGVQNWPGFEAVKGADLADKIRRQAQKSGTQFSRGKLVHVDFSKKPFVLTIEESGIKRQLLAKTCILALGAAAKKLGVPGENTYWSKGVHSCAVCDGALYRGKTVAVVGGGDSAILEATYLSGLAKKVYVVVRKDALRSVEQKRKLQLLEKKNVEILYESEVKEILGDKRGVKKIRLMNSKSQSETFKDVDALFLAIGAKPNTNLFKGLKLDSQGYIVANKDGETSISGVLAAGDIVSAPSCFKQAIIGSGEGARTALKAQMLLDSEPFSSIKLSSSSCEAPIKKEQKVASDSSDVIQISTLAQLQKVVSESKVPVLVDFYASWCTPCKALGTLIEESKENLAGKVTICKVKVDDKNSDQLTSSYQIRALPTALIFTPGCSFKTNPLGDQSQVLVGYPKISEYLEQFRKP